LVLPVVAAFWIFVLYMLWIIASSLKEVSATLKEIARTLANRS